MSEKKKKRERERRKKRGEKKREQKELEGKLGIERQGAHKRKGCEGRETKEIITRESGYIDDFPRVLPCRSICTHSIPVLS